MRMIEKKKRLNTAQLASALGFGMIGSILAAACYCGNWGPPWLKTGAAFVIIAAFLYLGAMVSEVQNHRTIGYASRQLVAVFLCAGLVLTGVTAALFQALLGTGKTLNNQALVLVVDRSGSMKGENNNRAELFLKALSRRIPKGKTVELYQFEEKYEQTVSRSPRSFEWDRSISLIDYLDKCDGESNTADVLNKLSNHRSAVIVLITDCIQIAGTDKKHIDELKNNGNSFIVVQLSNYELDNETKQAADAYLQYDKGTADEEVAAFISSVSSMFTKGMLTPVDGEQINWPHMLMLALLGGLVHLVLFTAFGLNRNMMIQLIAGVAEGAACYLILRLPMDFMPLLIHIALAILPFTLTLSLYTDVKQTMRNINVLSLKHNMKTPENTRETYEEERS